MKKPKRSKTRATETPTTHGPSGPRHAGKRAGTSESKSPDVEVVKGTNVGDAKDEHLEKTEASDEHKTIAELRAEVERLSDSLLRAKADFQNLQRRAAVERSDSIRYANAELMKSLLGVIDDFERSLSAIENMDNPATVGDGVRLVYDNFMHALRQQGLDVIDALHQPFDPNIHEALMQQACDDHPPGTVIAQAATGYRLRDRVLRPAKVVVSKAPDAAPAVASEPAEAEPGS